MTAIASRQAERRHYQRTASCHLVLHDPNTENVSQQISLRQKVSGTSSLKCSIYQIFCNLSVSEKEKQQRKLESPMHRALIYVPMTKEFILPDFNYIVSPANPKL